MAGLFSTPKPPPLPPPVRMPDPEDPAVRAARLLAIQKRQGASGRESTILNKDRLGNPLLMDAVGGSKSSVGTAPATPPPAAIGG